MSQVSHRSFISSQIQNRQGKSSIFGCIVVTGKCIRLWILLSHQEILRDDGNKMLYWGEQQLSKWQFLAARVGMTHLSLLFTLYYVRATLYIRDTDHVFQRLSQFWQQQRSIDESEPPRKLGISSFFTAFRRSIWITILTAQKYQMGNRRRF